MDIQGGWLYLGGDFNRVTGGTGFDTAGPLTLGPPRPRPDQRRPPDGTWKPNARHRAPGPRRDARRPRLRRRPRCPVAQRLRRSTRTTRRSSTRPTARRSPGLQTWQPNPGRRTERQNTILEVGNKVYQGGSQHYPAPVQPVTTTRFERRHMTKNAAATTRRIAFHDGILYGACHCVTDWQYEDANTAGPDPPGYARVDPINLIGAYDTTNNFRGACPSSTRPSSTSPGANGEGPWELVRSTRNNCMWAGGDLVRQGTSAEPVLRRVRALLRPRRAGAERPPNAKATVVGNDVTLSWNRVDRQRHDADPVRDPEGRPDVRHHRHGAIDVRADLHARATSSGPPATSCGPSTPTGNRSATTAVLVGHPPAAGGRDPARRPGRPGPTTARRRGPRDRPGAPRASTRARGRPARPSSAGATATRRPSSRRDVLTQYFVKHVNVSNPSAVQDRHRPPEARRRRGRVRQRRRGRARQPARRAAQARRPRPAASSRAPTRPRSSSTRSRRACSSTATTRSRSSCTSPTRRTSTASFDLELVARNGNETNAADARRRRRSPTSPRARSTVTWPARPTTSASSATSCAATAPSSTFTRAPRLLRRRAHAEHGLLATTSAPSTAPGNISAAGVASTTTTHEPRCWCGAATSGPTSPAARPGPTWNQPGFDTRRLGQRPVPARLG